MKRFLIFSIFFCFAAALNSSSNDVMDFEDREKLATAKCARELNVDEEKYEQLDIDLYEYIKNPDRETTCMTACTFRELMVDELTGPDNKATLYNGFLKMIDEAYKADFGNEANDFTREDVVKKVEVCYARTQNECDFFDCLKFYNEPLANVLAFGVMQSVMDPIFGPGSFLDD